MASAYARHLPHFALDGAEPRPAAATGIRAGGAPDLSGGEAAIENAAPEPEVIDREALAEARGRKAGLAEAEAEMERRLTAEREAHEARMAEMRAGWEAETAAQLAGGLASGLAEIEQAVTEPVARILAGFLEPAACDRALDELREATAALLARGLAAPVVLAGPRILVERFKAGLGAFEALETRIDDDAVDLTITVADTEIATRLAAWEAALARALTEGRDD